MKKLFLRTKILHGCFLKAIFFYIASCTIVSHLSPRVLSSYEFVLLNVTLCFIFLFNQISIKYLSKKSSQCSTLFFSFMTFYFSFLYFRSDRTIGMIYIPKLPLPTTEIPLTTCGDFSTMVVFNTTLLTPYQDSLEASLMFGGVRSALADFDPYVTGDQVSIVIPCRNEDAYIIRTLEYIFRNTAPENLLEVILIDDASDVPLETLINRKLPKSYRKKILVHRFEEKQGLIRSRIYGSDMARADNIFFLDGHCRVYAGWWNPLLRHLKANYKRVVSPIIKNIDAITWEDSGSSGYQMIFRWNFEFSWYVDNTNYIPIISGGILAVTKKWFRESGKYDSGMLEWGGENLEQSFRVWLCGGEIYGVLDSFVGHIFSRPPKPNINNQLVIQIQKNQKRAALVWLDEYYDYFFKYHTEANTLDPGDGLEERMALRKNLKSLPFAWYVEKFRLVMDLHSLLVNDFKRIVHHESNLCVTLGEPLNEKNVHLVVLCACVDDSDSQLWIPIAGDRMIMNFKSKMCISSSLTSDDIVASSCITSNMINGGESTQLWTYDDKETFHIYHDGNMYPSITGNDKIPKNSTAARNQNAHCIVPSSYLPEKEHLETNISLRQVSCEILQTDAMDPLAFIW